MYTVPCRLNHMRRNTVTTTWLLNTVVYNQRSDSALVHHITAYPHENFDNNLQMHANTKLISVQSGSYILVTKTCAQIAFVLYAQDIKLFIYNLLTCNSCNTGRCALPDVYARCPRARSARGRVRTYQSMQSYLCYN